MAELILISEAQKNTSHYTKFHFKGFYNGRRIGGAKLDSVGEVFQEGESYLLYIGEVKIRSDVLYGIILRSKNLIEVEL